MLGLTYNAMLSRLISLLLLLLLLLSSSSSCEVSGPTDWADWPDDIGADDPQ